MSDTTNPGDGDMHLRDAVVLITPKELSERWQGKITVKTLANWRSDPDKPKGPGYRRYGSKIFYPLELIEQYERQNQYGKTNQYSASGAANRKDDDDAK